MSCLDEVSLRKSDKKKLVGSFFMALLEVGLYVVGFALNSAFGFYLGAALVFFVTLGFLSKDVWL